LLEENITHQQLHKTSWEKVSGTLSGRLREAVEVNVSLAK